MTQRNPRHTNQSGGQRGTWARNHAVLIACIAGVSVLLAVVVVRVSGAHSSPPAPTAAAQHIRYLGVYEPGTPGSYSGVEEFARAVGRQPNLVSYYSGWGENFQKT